jgi:hypothetical protein
LYLIKNGDEAIKNKIKKKLENRENKLLLSLLDKNDLNEEESIYLKYFLYFI